MLNLFSQTEIAMRDTCLAYADGVALDRLCLDYGFPRPDFISTKAWRNAVRVALWGPRGTIQTLRSFLTEALMDYALKFTYKPEYQDIPEEEGDTSVWHLKGTGGLFSGETLDAARVWRVYKDTAEGKVQYGAAAGSVDGGFIGRDFVKLEPDSEKRPTIDTLMSRMPLRVVESEKTKAKSTDYYLTTAPTAYWGTPEKGDPSIAFPDNAGPGMVVPFTIEEPGAHPERNRITINRAPLSVPGGNHPANKWVPRGGISPDDILHGECKVFIRLFSELVDLFTFPYTYWLKSDADGDGVTDSTPAERPKGGQILLGEQIDGNPLFNGPYPAYLIDEEFLSHGQSRFWKAVKQLVPDGVHIYLLEGYSGWTFPTMGKNMKAVVTNDDKDDGWQGLGNPPAHPLKNSGQGALWQKMQTNGDPYVPPQQYYDDSNPAKGSPAAVGAGFWQYLYED
jgi:hypothetical protein